MVIKYSDIIHKSKCELALLPIVLMRCKIKMQDGVNDQDIKYVLKSQT